MRRFKKLFAGRQGFDPILGAKVFSKVVMARDFWFERLSNSQLHRSVSFTAVHPNPRDSTLVVELVAGGRERQRADHDRRRRHSSVGHPDQHHGLEAVGSNVIQNGMSPTIPAT
jgi:hypothetical protein